MAAKRLDVGRFLGATRTLYRAEGLVVSEVSHARPRELPRHVHEAAYYSLLLAGAYEEYWARSRLVYRPGSLGFHPPHFEHADRLGAAGGRFLAVELQSRWLDRLSEYAPLAGEAALLPPETSLIARRLLRECRADQPARALAIEALVLELLVETARRRPRADSVRPAWLDRVLERMEDEPLQDWSAEVLAAGVGVHPAHLARTFRRFEGRSLGAAAREARLRAAARLLERRELSLSDVAAAAGFADQSHFTRRFRRATGMTPGQYRRGGHSVRSASSGETDATRRAGSAPAASDTASSTAAAAAKLERSKRPTP